MKKYWLLAVVFTINFSTQAQVSEFGWLIGSWKQADKNIFEDWQIEGSSLKGSSYQIDSKAQRIYLEKIRLVKKEDSFFYVPEVAENNGEVYFKITSFSNTEFMAENQAHDFPKKIIYKLIDNTHLEASIQDDKKIITYTFQKTK